MSERVVGLLLTVVVGVFVARYLRPSGLGHLSYASSVFGLLAPVSLLGMQAVLTREFSTTEEWRRTLMSALAAQLPLAALASAFGFGVIAVTRGFEREAVLLGLVLAPVPLLGLSQTLRAYLEGVGRVTQVVLSGIAASLTAAIARVVAMLADAPVWSFGAFITVQSAVLFAGLAWGIPGRKRLAAKAHASREVALRLAAESWPLLVAALAVTVYMQGDIIMLTLMSGDAETGFYAAAVRLSELWYFIPTAALAAAGPRLSRLFRAREDAAYDSMTQRLLTASVVVSVLAVGGVLVAADLVVGTLYGRAFAPSADVLRIHILTAPFVFLGVIGSQWFIDRGMTRALMVRSCIGAIVNVALNLILIPRHGGVGAALATLAAYATSGVLLNGFSAGTRPLFKMQLAAAVLRWPADGSR